MANNKKINPILKKSRTTKSPRKIPAKNLTNEQSVISVDDYPEGMDILNGYNPASIVTRHGLQIFNKMRNDEQVKAALGTKKHAILSTGWDIIPASPSAFDKKLADFAKKSLTAWYTGSFDDTLFELTTFLDFGYAIAEENWMIEDGVIYLDHIKVRAPHDIEFHPDEFGNLGQDGLRQRQVRPTGPVISGMTVLDQQKFIIYTYRKEFDNWFGRSDLIECYRSWFIKDQLVKAEAIFLEKYGSPSIIAKVGQMKRADRQALMKIFRKLRSNSVAVIGDDVTTEIINPVAATGLLFRKAIRDHDEAISKAILMPNQLGFNVQEVGSFAKAKTHFNVFLWVVENIRRDMAEKIVNEQIIKRLIFYNFGEQDGYPEFRWNPMDEEDKAELFKVWLEALKIGAVIQTKEDEDMIRKGLGFPERNEDSTPMETPTEDDDISNKDISNDINKNDDIDTPEELQKIEFNEDYGPKQVLERVNFKKINSVFTEEEEIFYKEIDNTLDIISIEAIDRIQNKKIVANKRMDEINKFQLKYVGDLRRTFQKAFQRLYIFGLDSWKSEQPKEKFETKNELLPSEYNQWLTSSAYMEAGKLADAYKTMVKEELLVGINNGWSEKKIMERIKAKFARAQIPGTDVAPLFKGSRIRTIVRTNINSSFNKARYMQSLKLSEEPKAQIYRLFSEILEGRTKESHPFSKVIHGKYVLQGTEISQRLQYPMHYNDRGVEITIDGSLFPIPPNKILTAMPDLSQYKGLLIV